MHPRPTLNLGYFANTDRIRRICGREVESTRNTGTEWGWKVRRLERVRACSDGLEVNEIMHLGCLAAWLYKATLGLVFSYVGWSTDHIPWAVQPRQL